MQRGLVVLRQHKEHGFAATPGAKLKVNIMPAEGGYHLAYTGAGDEHGFKLY
jgi:hypothetical protein